MSFFNINIFFYYYLYIMYYNKYLKYKNKYIKLQRGGMLGSWWGSSDSGEKASAAVPESSGEKASAAVPESRGIVSSFTAAVSSAATAVGSAVVSFVSGKQQTEEEVDSVMGDIKEYLYFKDNEHINKELQIGDTEIGRYDYKDLEGNVTMKFYGQFNNGEKVGTGVLKFMQGPIHIFKGNFENDRFISGIAIYHQHPTRKSPSNIKSIRISKINNLNIPINPLKAEKYLSGIGVITYNNESKDIGRILEGTFVESNVSKEEYDEKIETLIMTEYDEIEDNIITIKKLLQTIADPHIKSDLIRQIRQLQHDQLNIFNDA